MLEKKAGIARRLAIPDPADALVLQCIVDALEPQLREAQPSKKAYYSRSHMPPNIERIDGTFAYPWFQLWPEFQKRIWQFADTHSCIVITDIANYYDTIPLSALRNSLASLVKISENVLNLLFFLLESFVWRPYYMPHSGVGLPQLNFDAPRLLAHVYLFKADEELQQLSGGEFVRWMDDINAGVNSLEEGKKLLASLQKILNSQGLQLNVGKSRIMTGQEALAHFSAYHNRALSVIENAMNNGAGTPRTVSQERKLRSSYKKFRKADPVGNWEKVQMRYLNLFGKLCDPFAFCDLRELLENYPATRGAVFRYLTRLGFAAKHLSLVETFVASGHCEDEGAMFEAVRCLVTWQVPNSMAQTERFRAISAILANKKCENPAFSFGAAMWILTKYANSDDLMEFIVSNRNTWERSEWASRQVASVTPLLPKNRRSEILEMLQNSGLLQGLQVWENIARLSALKTFDSQLRAYLMHPIGDRPFPLAKVVLARAMLSGKLRRQQKQELKDFLISNVRDKRYLRIIRARS